MSPRTRQELDLLQTLAAAAELIAQRLRPPIPLVAPFLSVDQACEYSGLTSRAIHRLRRKGALHCIPDRDGWKIRRVDLEKLAGCELSRLDHALLDHPNGNGQPRKLKS